MLFKSFIQRCVVTSYQCCTIVKCPHVVIIIVSNVIAINIFILNNMNFFTWHAKTFGYKTLGH